LLISHKLTIKIKLIVTSPSYVIRNCLIAAVSEAIRTSLGPRGMDKMVRSLPDYGFNDEFGC